jgi:hypothetical protein
VGRKVEGFHEVSRIGSEVAELDQIRWQGGERMSSLALGVGSSREEEEAESSMTRKGKEMTESVLVGVRGRRSLMEQVEPEGERRGAI